MNNKEKIIREKRTLEATKKNLMGPVGKLGVIAKYLGSPIVAQGSGMFDQVFLDDPYEEQNNSEEMPTFEDHETVYELGWIYDGLGQGLHLEIKYFNPENKLTVYYKGYEVYKEVSGELEAYAPFEEWEDAINELYTRAKINQKNKKKENKQEKENTMEKSKYNFLEKLRMRWGI